MSHGICHSQGPGLFLKSSEKEQCSQREYGLHDLQDA
jgi:hypothetical protein